MDVVNELDDGRVEEVGAHAIALKDVKEWSKHVKLDNVSVLVGVVQADHRPKVPHCREDTVALPIRQHDVHGACQHAVLDGKVLGAV